MRRSQGGDVPGCQKLVGQIDFSFRNKPSRPDGDLPSANSLISSVLQPKKPINLILKDSEIGQSSHHNDQTSKN
jgi:hypothetical protein